MKNYTKINPSFADKGDIVILDHSIYLDYPRERRYILNDRPSNNGNVTGRSLHIKYHHINVDVDKNIIGIYRRNEKKIEPHEIARR